MSLNVEVKVNYEDDELYCMECKNQINLGEKYLVIIDELFTGEITKRPIHLDCIQETFEDEFEQPFISPT